MGKENTTLLSTRWREKVKDSERNYNRQNRRDPKVELDELNSETDTPRRILLSGVQMPLYEYACADCGEECEVLQKSMSQIRRFAQIVESQHFNG